jgi:hypothetical protein
MQLIKLITMQHLLRVDLLLLELMGGQMEFLVFSFFGTKIKASSSFHPEP